MDGVSFRDWWLMNDHLQDFWIVSPHGVAVSLGPRPQNIFKQILEHMQSYHDKLVPHGNLFNCITIVGDQVKFSESNSNLPETLEELLALLEKDLMDFKKMFEWAEHQAMGVNAVQQAPASIKFHELYATLPHFRAFSVGGLRFAFFLRNNPLLMSVTEKHIFSRQVLSIYEHDKTLFAANVDLKGLQGWSLKLTDQRLIDVRDYKRDWNDQYPANYLDYKKPEGSVKFLKNCLGHIRDGQRGKGQFYNDAAIITMFENDLPDIIPTWFNSLVWGLELHPVKSLAMCRKSWMEFLKDDGAFT